MTFSWHGKGRKGHSPKQICLIKVKINQTGPMHYVEVVEIGILKCPTLTTYFSVVFHPGCPKLGVELCQLPKNIEKEKRGKFEQEKEGKNAKNVKGVFAKVNIGHLSC